MFASRFLTVTTVIGAAFPVTGVAPSRDQVTAGPRPRPCVRRAQPQFLRRSRHGVALALFLRSTTRLSRVEAAMLQCRPQAGLIEGQGLADAVPNRAGLTGKTAAGDGAPHVELAEPVDYDKQLIETACAKPAARNRPGCRAR